MQATNESKGTRRDVYKLITQRIIDQLEKGVVPWQKPWHAAGIPKNALTGRSYQGINALYLSSLGYEQNLFLTYAQVNRELNGKVKQGEHGHTITWWKTEKAKDDEKPKTYLQYYTVFHVSQCEGLPEKFSFPQREVEQFPTCVDIIANMPKRPDIRHKARSAYYHPIDDYVNMPKQASFKSDAAYYSVLFHELVHSTGHRCRLHRKDIIEMPEFGSDQYSHEELVAEIGACFLSSITGLECEFENSAGYIQGWLGVLQNDKRFILSASSAAQKAVNFILNVDPFEEDTEEIPE